jgi:RluA family pseudouridine synthase
MNVHPWDHKTKEVSLIELVQDMLGESYNSLSYKPALVHRIDRDTSGAIMIAKEKKTLEWLLTLLQTGKIEKIYHAVVCGTPLKPRDTIRAKLLRIEDARDEAKVQIHPDGQEAITHYETLQTRIHEKYSLLSIRIETGRTHQIRVHMASLGCPILGDKAYGNIGENSFARRNYSTWRQMLHARELHFMHPITKKSITVIAPYHPDMTNLIG